MIGTLLVRVLRRLMSAWQRYVAMPYRRLRLCLDCRLHNIELLLGKNIRFYHPVRVWGVGGRLIIENDVYFAFDGGNRCQAPISLQLRAPGAELRIGRGVCIMPASQLLAFTKVVVGSGTMFGFGCLVIDSDVHDFTPGLGERPGRCAPVRIGQQARICPEVTILKGVTVGDNTVIGNKSVVQTSLPPSCVAAGNPARVYLHFKPAPSAATEQAVPA
jgi:galactoside O-acetyltransferase